MTVTYEHKAKSEDAEERIHKIQFLNIANLYFEARCDNYITYYRLKVQQDLTSDESRL